MREVIAAALFDELALNSFFAGVPRDELASLDPSAFEVRSLPPGDVLIAEGAASTELFLVLSGALRVSRAAGDRRSVDVTDRGAGEFIGEMGLLESRPRSSTLTCVTDVRVAAVGRDAFFELLERFPVVYRNLARTLAERQRESDRRTTEETRRYDALLELNQRIQRQKRELERLNAELAEKNQELFRLATTDRLTGVFNRAYMNEILERSLADGKSAGTPLGVVLVDVDHFKSFNDRHGHLVGDLVLRETAQRILRATPSEGRVFRYGGEEFVVVLSGTLARAEQLAEHLRTTIEAAELHTGTLALKVTISLGVASFDPTRVDATVDALLQAADEALYVAKRGGRNRVSLAP